MSGSDKLIRDIVHYQGSLSRYAKENNDTKMLHCICKLSNMPIAVSHLEKTGVGRTVNSLRKLENSVGDAAKALVAKWKSMVAKDDETCDETPTSDNINQYSEKLNHKERRVTESNSSHKDGDRSRKGWKPKSSGDDDDKRTKEDKHKSHSKNSSCSNSGSSGEDRASDYGNSDNDGSQSEDDDSCHKRKDSTRSSIAGKSNDRDDSKDRKSRDSNRSDKYDRKRKRDGSDTSDDDSRRAKKKTDKSDSDCDKSSHGHKKSGRSSSDSRHKHDRKSSSKDPKRDGKKNDDKDRKDKGGRTEKDSKREKGGDSAEKDKRDKHDKSKSRKHESKAKPEKTKKVKDVQICSESGTSFAEALGMLEPTTSKAAVKKSKPSSQVSTPEKVHCDRSPVEKERKSHKSEIVIPIPPPPPKVDLDINISSLLPTITPNYRPISTPLIDAQNTRNKILNEEEALTLVMYQKNLRTKVYSGNKCAWGEVPTLFELCTRVLQDNIDALEFTGGVPYSILKPVLDKATPDQLFVMEHHNPYLIGDTDELWALHCQKDFRTKKRQELEAWREMYLRCLDEREAKLKVLTANIKQSQDKSLPVRQTKLAYIDSEVKPPRNIARKQAKNGLDKKPFLTPTARLNAIASATSSQVAVPSPVSRSSSSTGGGGAHMKQKKAPLMQKTLAFLKGGRFRR